jgi:chromosome segregation ATPase
MTNDELKARLNDLGNRIEKNKKELQLHGIFGKEHQLTQEELDARYKKLKMQLDQEVETLETANHHVNEFEKTILNWVNSLDLDSR